MLRLLQPVDAIGGFYNDLNQFLWPSLAPELFDEVGPDVFLGSGSGIGSGVEGDGTVNVFSAGAASALVGAGVRGQRLWCVRGPLTAQAVSAEPNAAITDGALLVQTLVPPERPPVGVLTIGVMPRFESLLTPGWVESCSLAQLELLSPVGPPLEVIDRVRSVELLLTESLHGAVMADTFGIPWLPFATTAGFNQFKWVDWAMSFPLPLQATLLPPPSAVALLKEGRPPGRWGSQLGLNAHAVSVAKPSRRRDAAARVADSPVLSEAVRRGFKLGPARTAEALLQMSRLDAVVSPLHRRKALASAMMDRFDTLCRLNGSRLKV